jgi:hypothetical protein
MQKGKGCGKKGFTPKMTFYDFDADLTVPPEDLQSLLPLFKEYL